jgi:Holliday junction resolvase-like predicted endonuclease
MQQLIENKQFSMIGNYWESGNANEIDIVAVNDLQKQISFFEIKRQKSKIDLSILEKKSQNLVTKFNNYTLNYTGLSMEDM